MKWMIPLLLTCVSVMAGPGRQLLNLDKSGLAIQGYDPVAYFTMDAAVKGKPQFQATHEGATYWFASEGNLNKFKAAPQKYVPEFGGYCAWATANNKLAKVDPEAFQIVDGRLLLQYSKGIRDKFNKDTEGNLKKADANWPGLVAKHGK